MSRLRVEPGQIVETVPELSALARDLALQAVELYRALAERMAEFGNESARDAFAALEAEQRRHADALQSRFPSEAAAASDAGKGSSTTRIWARRGW